MELSLNTIVLSTATLLTGLSAGLFYAWQISVIPGTKRASDDAYLETMQHINRAIINPFFMLIFFGSFIAQIISLFLFAGLTLSFWLLIAATIANAITLGITGSGNVPLNNELDNVDLKMLTEQLKNRFRSSYESPWNRLHLIRTVFAVISFILLLLVFLTT